MRRDVIIMGEREEETRRRFEKGIYKNYSHVLACKPSLIRVNCWNHV